MSELTDCTNSLSAKDILRAATKKGPPFYINVLGLTSYCGAFQAVLDAYTGTIPDATQLAAQNNMCCTLYEAGLWDSQWDLFYILANGDSPNCLLNWINPGTFGITPVHFPLFTAWRGITGDGDRSGNGNDYLNTGWDPITDRVNFAPTDCCYWIYVRDNAQDDGYVVGVESSTGSRLLFRPRSSGNVANAWINASSSISYSPNTNGSGLWVINRTGAAATELWQNKISRATDTDAYNAMSTRDIILLARDDEGVFSSYSGNEIAAFGIGKSLSQAKVNTLTDTVETYMDAIGAGVI